MQQLLCDHGCYWDSFQQLPGELFAVLQGRQHTSCRSCAQRAHQQPSKP
jgi:hypothetical protein